MVELRSGRCIDLGHPNKTLSGRVTTHSDRKTTGSPRTKKPTRIELSFDFEIYKDDPLAARSDLNISPLNGLGNTVTTDKENEEPCPNVPARSRQAPELSAQARLSSSDRARVSAPAAGPSRRSALHQISYDEQHKTRRPTNEAEISSSYKDGAGASDRSAQKATNTRPSQGQSSLTGKQSSKASQHGLKRVSMLDLR